MRKFAVAAAAYLKKNGLQGEYFRRCISNWILHFISGSFLMMVREKRLRGVVRKNRFVNIVNKNPSPPGLDLDWEFPYWSADGAVWDYEGFAKLLEVCLIPMTTPLLSARTRSSNVSDNTCQIKCRSKRRCLKLIPSRS